MFDESKHKRDENGKFAKQDERNYSDSVNDRIKWAKDNDIELPLNADGSVDDIALQKLQNVSRSSGIIKINLDADIQKQFDNASPKERSKIAFDYMMKNLRGKYMTEDKEEVRIERVGAKEISHTLYEPKIRVSPELGRLIENSRFLDLRKADHGIFNKFAYYEARVAIGRDIYSAILNIGIRTNGESTLYDVNQFKKQ